MVGKASFLKRHTFYIPQKGKDFATRISKCGEPRNQLMADSSPDFGLLEFHSKANVDESIGASIHRRSLSSRITRAMPHLSVLVTSSHVLVQLLEQH